MTIIDAFQKNEKTHDGSEKKRFVFFMVLVSLTIVGFTLYYVYGNDESIHIKKLKDGGQSLTFLELNYKKDFGIINDVRQNFKMETSIVFIDSFNPSEFNIENYKKAVWNLGNNRCVFDSNSVNRYMSLNSNRLIQRIEISYIPTRIILLKYRDFNMTYVQNLYTNVSIWGESFNSIEVYHINGNSVNKAPFNTEFNSLDMDYMPCNQLELSINDYHNFVVEQSKDTPSFSTKDSIELFPYILLFISICSTIYSISLFRVNSARIISSELNLSDIKLGK